MSVIEQSIQVNVPVRTAYNQWTQFEEFPKFMEGVEEVEQVNDKRLHNPQGIVEHMGDAVGVVTRRVEGDLKRFKDFIKAYRSREVRG